MELTMKELKMHTLRGDIQQIGMETSYNKRGIRSILEQRYVNLDSDITQDEFDRILSEEYIKVVAWCTQQSKPGTGTYGTVIRGDGKSVKVYIPSKEDDE